ncbi:hypothetical protein E3Q22_03003 [Wallemia mellicola]|uniref:RAVE complex protein Rav1 C-terminal domain-containing protein n=1 Tax=Wallemia mellicola TaxID=1708541 RepID=A0A4T0P6X3_9BASI|nr:hypothetical protein E3Q22_03003 [Wallemia mellicola]TIB84583.1 hypothetical protein E3Q21_02318 [Wallemia mellicola]TIB87807.1 hypothetical protein E3Q20_02313 [Wallemia mellicola]TIB98774.1 hypothetical protein E3Q17_02876 [Wallemia mellicola]TIC04897.1 hypothetical protein E3Q16_02496 [Wallemia mellicola]
MYDNDECIEISTKINNLNSKLILNLNNYLFIFNFNFKILNFYTLPFRPKSIGCYDDLVFIEGDDCLDIIKLDGRIHLVHSINLNGIISYTHHRHLTVVLTKYKLLLYKHYRLSQSVDLHSDPQLASISPNLDLLALSYKDSSTVHLYSITDTPAQLQLLPHLSLIRSIQWRDNNLLIIETVDNDLYAYHRSSPSKFEPWTIYVSPSLLRSFWLGPSTTDLLLRRALSDSNYLLHQSNPLSSLIAERRYERVSQISQYSRDLILNISSDGYNLTINAIHDTTHESSNYIRSQPVVHIKLPDSIPNDIIDIEISCQDHNYSPIYLLALRDNNKGILVGILNPASIFDPIPDTKAHPPIEWLRNIHHTQHFDSITKINTDSFGHSLSTYSHNEKRLINWNILDSPSNALHKLRMIESGSNFNSLDEVLDFICVNDVTVIAFKNDMKVFRNNDLITNMPSKLSSSVTFTNTSHHIYVIEYNNSEVSVRWLSLKNCVVEYEQSSPVDLKQLSVSSAKFVNKHFVPSYKSRSRDQIKVKFSSPIVTILDRNNMIRFLRLSRNELKSLPITTAIDCPENIVNIQSCFKTHHTAIVSSDAKGSYLRVYKPTSNKYGSDLEFEYRSCGEIRDVEFLFLDDFEEGLCLLFNERSSAKVFISTHDEQKRWIELTTLTLPDYESGRTIDHVTFLQNASIGLLCGSNLHIQSILHLMSVDIKPYARDAPLCQSSLYELTAELAGPVQEWHNIFLINCLRLNEYGVLKRIFKYLQRAVKTQNTGDLHAKFVQEVDDKDDDSDEKWPQVDDEFLQSIATLKGVVGNEGLYNELKCTIEAINYAYNVAKNADENAWRFLVFSKLGILADNSVIFGHLSHNHQLLIEQLEETKSVDEIRSTYPSLWIGDSDLYQQLMDRLAKKMAVNHEDEIDPTLYGSSLIYFALGKKNSVSTLWKFAYGHRERDNILKFLLKDFDNDNNAKVAATKNAFALLSKRRYGLQALDYAAAFFVLAGKTKDAIQVCLKQCQDFEMALCIARLRGDWELYTDVTKELAKYAVKSRNRALASVTISKLGQHHLASRCLVESFSTLLSDLVEELGEIKENDLANKYDFDISLVSVYLAQPGVLRVVDERELALYTAKQLRKNGTHALALRLLARWKFPKSSKEVPKPYFAAMLAPDPISRASSTPKTNVIASTPKQSSQHVDQFDMSAFNF